VFVRASPAPVLAMLNTMGTSENKSGLVFQKASIFGGNNCAKSSSLSKRTVGFLLGLVVTAASTNIRQNRAG
jgi:hypothetical protein